MALDSSSGLEMENCTFDSNVATSSGGVLFSTYLISSHLVSSHLVMSSRRYQECSSILGMCSVWIRSWWLDLDPQLSLLPKPCTIIRRRHVHYLDHYRFHRIIDLFVQPSGKRRRRHIPRQQCQHHLRRHTFHRQSCPGECRCTVLQSPIVEQDHSLKFHRQHRNLGWSRRCWTLYGTSIL